MAVKSYLCIVNVKAHLGVEISAACHALSLSLYYFKLHCPS